MRNSFILRFCALAAVVVLMSASWTPLRGGLGGSTPIVPSADKLSGEWWQWALGVPADENPLFDDTGEFADVDQPYKASKVFFLAGTFDASGVVERSITIPSGTALFFPLVNSFFADSLGRGRDRANNPALPDLKDSINTTIDNVTDVFATLNDVSLDANIARLQSPNFVLTLPENNIFGAPAGKYTPAVSDGYYCYIPPLAPGTYTLHFGGTFGAPDNFSLDITYHITVK